MSGWFMKLIGSTSGNVAEVNSENALITVPLPPSGSYYTHAVKTGTIGATAAANAAVYIARLNPGYAGKLFHVFARLHSPREFEGMGMGLALTRKIIERHGGTVWATATPKVGCSVSFTLPLA